MINDRENSRHKGRPVNLYLFKGIEPSLENLARSVTLSPGATEFGLGTTPVSGDFVGRIDQFTQEVWGGQEDNDELVLEEIAAVVDNGQVDVKILLSYFTPEVVEDGTFTIEFYGALGAPGDLIYAETVDVPYFYDEGAGVVGKELFFTVPAGTRSYIVRGGPVFFQYIIFFTYTLGTESRVTNRLSGQPYTDFVHSVDDMMVCLPKVSHVNLMVSWHGTDLRVGECEIVPKVERATLSTTPYSWQVGPLVRSGAQVLSRIANKPVLGGAPSDRSIHEAITYLKSKGLSVTVCPIMLMDIPTVNDLPSPYGGDSQPAYPDRSLITCHPAPGETGTVDLTAAAATQMEAFFGTVEATDFSWNSTENRVNYSGPSDEWSMRRFILHMATIAADAGADGFLIGSELMGITKVRSDDGSFPAVDQMVSMLPEVRALVGSEVEISYAAHHTEFHSYQPSSGNILFPLDDLWANDDINYVGINNFMPVTDWRNGDHLDRAAGYLSEYQKNYIQSNIESGEYFDWFYASFSDRTDQVRTPIEDASYGEDWILRNKDIRGWWSNEHRVRVSGVRDTVSTAWVPESKQIAFTEIGIPAVHRGTNDPDSVYIVHSSASAFPPFSSLRPDAAVQRAALEAHLFYWKTNGGDMLYQERVSLHTWDARPFPTFPDRDDYFTDAGNWLKGYWLNGRLRPGFGFEAGQFGPYAFCDGEEAITRDGITYQPFPISISDINSSGDLDKSDITVTLARGSEDFEAEFIGFPVSQVINLTVFHGHTDDAPTLYDYPAIWVGRVGAPAFEEDSISFNCVPVSTSIQRPGLRRNYQLSCSHALFGPQCRASKVNATTGRVVTAILGNTVTFATPLPLAGQKYRGGLLEWSASGRSAIRTIVAVNDDKTTLTIRGNLRDLVVGAEIKITFGCNRLQTDCSELHSNILNFGGQPFIPLENPLSQKNIFY